MFESVVTFADAISLVFKTVTGFILILLRAALRTCVCGYSPIPTRKCCYSTLVYALYSFFSNIPLLTQNVYINCTQETYITSQYKYLKVIFIWLPRIYINYKTKHEK